jgi:uncharacterized membrane protein
MSDPIYTAPTDYGGPDDKTMTIVVYALYLLGFITGGLTTLLGLVMAYVQKNSASERAYSHYVFLIRTFWIAVGWTLVAAALLIVGIPLSVVLIGIPLLLAAKLVMGILVIWYGVRCIVGLVAAAQDQAYGQPRSWFL